MRGLSSPIDDRLRPLLCAVSSMNQDLAEGVCLPTLIAGLAVTPSERLNELQRRHLDLLCRKACTARTLWSCYDDHGRRTADSEPLANAWQELLAGVLLAHAGESVSTEDSRRGPGLSRLNAALRLLDGMANDVLRDWANDLLSRIGREQPV